MAVDTSITVQTGAADTGKKVVVYQRLIDFSADNLSDGDWFDLFQMPTAAVVIGGASDLVLTGTASSTFDVGVEGGAELLSATTLDGTTGTITAFTATVGVVFDGTTIDVSINTAAAVLGKLRITAIVAYCDAL